MYFNRAQCAVNKLPKLSNWSPSHCIGYHWSAVEISNLCWKDNQVYTKNVLSSVNVRSRHILNAIMIVNHNKNSQIYHSAYLSSDTDRMLGASTSSLLNPTQPTPFTTFLSGPRKIRLLASSSTVLSHVINKFSNSLFQYTSYLS